MKEFSCTNVYKAKVTEQDGMEIVAGKKRKAPKKDKEDKTTVKRAKRAVPEPVTVKNNTTSTIPIPPASNGYTKKSKKEIDDIHEELWQAAGKKPKKGSKIKGVYLIYCHELGVAKNGMLSS